MSGHLNQAGADAARPFGVHIEEAGIEVRFESMCRARGFAYATARLEAVRQRVHQQLLAEGHSNASEWIG